MTPSAFFFAAFVASAAAQSYGCSGNILLGEWNYNVANFFTMNPLNGTVTPFFTYNLPTGYNMWSFRSNNDNVFMMVYNPNTAANSQIIRYNLNTNKSTSMQIPSSVFCSDFFFDDALFGENGAGCLSGQTTGNCSLVAINPDSHSVKTIGTFPYFTIENSMHSYDPHGHVYYLELSDNSGVTGRLVGLSARTGKVVSDVALPNQDLYASPLAIDPLTAKAYTTVIGAGGATQVSLINLSNGDLQTIGGIPNALWSQGGFSAVISSSDRCSLAFFMMINSSQQQFYVISIDMSSGKMVSIGSIPFHTVNNIDYYAPSV